ncbi:MAG TPA: phosphomannose isomerase type II C-terminal cupin domain [Microvirga sp.]|nr:phosphomannose isomerase type II C-terminal cupin domain [Microvirga sp.]
MHQIVADLASAARHTPIRYTVGECDTRPWGTWEVLATGASYAIKRIVVMPGQRLSLQYHEHRAEHWMVVQGHAEAEVNGVVHALHEGEHIYVPLGAHHRIRNVGDIPVVLLEVQVGAYLDEHDIVRLQDDYART